MRSISEWSETIIYHLFVKMKKSNKSFIVGFPSRVRAKVKSEK